MVVTMVVNRTDQGKLQKKTLYQLEGPHCDGIGCHQDSSYWIYISAILPIAKNAPRRQAPLYVVQTGTSYLLTLHWDLVA